MTRTDQDLRAMYAELADAAPAADRVLDVLTAPTDRRRGRGPVPSTPDARPAGAARRPRAWRLAAGGAVAAAAVTVGALLLPTGHHGVGPASAQAEAVTVLDDAATAARATSDVVPRADQFYYTNGNGGERWLSVDGTHDGAGNRVGEPRTVLPGCRAGIALTEGNYTGVRPQPCTPTPAYLPDLPDTATAMTAYLQDTYGSGGANGIGKGVYDLLTDHYLRPAVQAAIFQAITTMPGLRIAPDDDNPADLGVTWSVSGADDTPDLGQSSTTLLFDRTTHAFTGISTIGLKGEPGFGAASTLSGIVDRVGELP